MLLGLVFDAAIIGLIIAVMEGSEFPGWGPMIGCALLIGITSRAVGSQLPGPLSLLGVVAGAIVGAFAISWLCSMSYRRSAIAAGIYLAISGIGGLLFGLLASA